MGAAESVWAMVLCESAASASERVFGVRPEGVVGVKLPVDGGSSSESPMVVYVWECGVTLVSFCWENSVKIENLVYADARSVVSVVMFS